MATDGRLTPPVKAATPTPRIDATEPIAIIAMSCRTPGGVEDSEAYWTLLAEGRVKPLMDSSFPLEKAADAHRRMETSAHIGKIVLAV